MSQPVKYFAEKLNQLLEVKRKPDGAKYSQTDPRYFFEDDDRATSKATLVIENELVKQIAVRSTLLNEDGKKHILDMIEFILKTAGTGWWGYGRR